MNLPTEQAEALAAELHRLFCNRVAAGAMVVEDLLHERIDLDLFDNPLIDVGWWANVLAVLANTEDGRPLQGLINRVARLYPGNTQVDALATTRFDADTAAEVGNLLVTTAEHPDLRRFQEIGQILDDAKQMGVEGRVLYADIDDGIDGNPDGAYIMIEADYPDELRLSQFQDRLIRDINSPAHVDYEATLLEQRRPIFLLDPLHIRRIDGKQHRLERVESRTDVDSLIEAVLGPDTASADIFGQPKGPPMDAQATVPVIVKPNGERKTLNRQQEIGLQGVRSGDVIELNPERTAGAISPLEKEQALRRVLREIKHYKSAHADLGFRVRANATTLPTEYELSFQAPGFAPPSSSGGEPARTDMHRVLVRLPDAFPYEAPQAWWLTPIFHPNIREDSGAVCLGALREYYRPAMDLAELCQMLVDLARYHNYAVNDPVNDIASEWARSPQGQRLIADIGGQTLRQRGVAEGEAPQPRTAADRRRFKIEPTKPDAD